MNVPALKSKIGRIAATGTGLVLALPVMAQEVTDPGLAALESLETKGGLYVAAAFALATITVGGFWALAMYKKVAGKAR